MISPKTNFNTKECFFHLLFPEDKVTLFTRPYNYTVDTAYEILKSDAMKHNSDDEILSYVKKNLMQLDNKFGDD